MKILATLALLCFALPLLADAPSDDPFTQVMRLPQAPRPPQAPRKVAECPCGCPCATGFCTCADCQCEFCPGQRLYGMSYKGGFREAKRTGKPLVLFVGQGGKPVKGCVVAYAETFAGVKDKGVIVGKMHGGKMVKAECIKGTPATSAIRKAAFPPRPRTHVFAGGGC